MSTLEVRDLRVRFGRAEALRGVTLSLRPGVTGLVGANGAGKSTLIRTLATLQRPSGGQLVWDGQDVTRRPNALRRVLGYVPQSGGAYPQLTPTEFLQYMGAAKRLNARAVDAQIPALLDAVNLSAHAGRPIGSFSGGMARRVLIAQALLGDPALLILDEPSVGLDAEERARFQALLREQGKRAAVLLVTHIQEDLDAAAGRLLTLEGGVIAGETVQRRTPSPVSGPFPLPEWEVARA
ncbi:ATP-binding cassette domain-containing protein [Deinococcus sp. HMF7620]|uniref:ATP-binding cassette domain-containing protein n=1 Tax=Deinococcus arboris TaxID=2682977 RepID=A0A7C9HPZ0_9DEIO|nr:ATP-binding cassette domain-containing protein [Deinococcus arboris]